MAVDTGAARHLALVTRILITLPPDASSEGLPGRCDAKTDLAFLPVLVLAAAALVACGGNPSGPDAEGIVVRGTVQGKGALRAASAGTTSAATVTVSVLEAPSISTTVAGDGSFTLRGLPQAAFTLVFKSGLAEIGRRASAEVKANQEITGHRPGLDAGVVLLEEQRNGIGHGDVEIEGNVGQIVALNPTGDSRFVINGRTVVARPGETAVREGNRSCNIEDVTEGRHVHVKGVWLPIEGSGLSPCCARDHAPGRRWPGCRWHSRRTGQGRRRLHEDGGRRPHLREVRLHHHRQPAGQGVHSRAKWAARRFARATRPTRWPSSAGLARARLRTAPGVSGGTCRVASDEVKVQQFRGTAGAVFAVGELGPRLRKRPPAGVGGCPAGAEH